MGRVARAGGQLAIPCSYDTPEHFGRGVALLVADRGRVHVLAPGRDFPSSLAARTVTSTSIIPAEVEVTLSSIGGRRWSALASHIYGQDQGAEQYSRHVMMAAALGCILASNDFVTEARALERAGIPGLTVSTLPRACRRFADEARGQS